MNSTHQKLFEDKMETDMKGLEAKQTRLFVGASMTNFKPLDVFLWRAFLKHCKVHARCCRYNSELLQPQWLCEGCGVGYCFSYKELPDLAIFPRSHIKV